MTAEKPLPCPHCGSRDIRFGTSDDGGRYIQCHACGATGRLVYPLKEPAEPILLEWWNRRAAPSLAAGGHTRESVRAEFAAEVGDCCKGGDPMCSTGCLVEIALKRRAAGGQESTKDAGDAVIPSGNIGRASSSQSDPASAVGLGAGDTALGDALREAVALIDADKWPGMQTVNDMMARAAAELRRLEVELAREREAHAQLQARCYDYGGTFQNVFDDLAAIAERERRLTEVLRERVIVNHPQVPGAPWAHECNLCGDHMWRTGEPERHAPGCLAAPPGAER